MSYILNRLIVVVSFFVIFATFSHAAYAAKSKAVFQERSSSSSDNTGKMMMDISAHYVRDTQPQGDTDTAGRFSIGGMFNDWIGLDLQGLYQVKSKDYLIGADLKLQVTDWFFVKGGMGAYAEKTTKEFKTTPLAGLGIMAPFTSSYYFLTEFSYFQVNDSNNISFGAGLGFFF